MSLFRRQSTADPAEPKFVYDPEAYPEEPPKKGIPWRAINAAVILPQIVLPVGLAVMIFTVGISWKLFLIALFANLILGAVSMWVRQQGTGRKLLHVMRVIAIGSVVLYYVPSTVGIGFTETRWMYPLKRFVYVHGISGYGEVLPEKLPQKCEGYFFRTEVQMIAQDYHPSSYLAFYTDPAELDRLAAEFGGRRTVTKTLDEMDDEERERLSYLDFPNCPEEIPPFVVGRVHPAEELHGAVVYVRSDSYYSKGLVLDYDSGYVIYWT